jgi:CHASE2 domain-containing sensor protein
MITMVSLVVMCVLWLAGATESAELLWYDVRLFGALAEDVHESVVAIPIDNRSTDELGRFPWVRPLTAELFVSLRKQGARVVAGDLVFTDKSSDESNDATMANILEKADGIVVAFSGRHASQQLTKRQRQTIEQWEERYLSEMPPINPEINTIPEFARLVVPIPEVFNNVDMLGLTGVEPDRDGKLRRIPMVRVYQGRYLPSFSLAMVAEYFGVPMREIRVEPGFVVLPAAMMDDGSVRDYSIPVTPRGDMWIRYADSPGWIAQRTSDNQARYVSAYIPVMNPERPETIAAVKDKIAIVYTAFTGNTDFHSTPRSTAYPGGLIQAEAISTILTGNFLYPGPRWVTAVVMLLVAVGLGLLGPRLSSFRLALLGLTAFFGITLGATLVLRVAAVMTEVIPILGLTLMQTVSMIVHRTWTEERERIDLMWTLQVLERHALNERQDAGAMTTVGETGATGDPSLLMRRNMEYGRFIESLREIESLPNTYIGKHYRLTRLIDEGGMGLVFQAHDEALDRTVAVKVLTKYSAKLLNRFKVEAKAIGQIDHENVVKVFAVAKEGDIPYIVMEYVDGISLSAKIREEGPLPLVDALKVLRQVALGLDAAHRKNIIHRDIKTSNVLIDQDGGAKVIDFGIAKFFRSGDQGITGSREILGTADYMSPEQGAGKALTHKTDIYSLGIVLYRTLTGRLPFRAEDTVAVLLKHMREPLPDLREKRPDVPVQVMKVLDKMVAKSPEDRYGTCLDLVKDLDRVIDSLDADSDRATGPTNLAKETSEGSGQ